MSFIKTNDCVVVDANIKVSSIKTCNNCGMEYASDLKECPYCVKKLINKIK